MRNFSAYFCELQVITELAEYVRLETDIELTFSISTFII